MEAQATAFGKSFSATNCGTSARVTGPLGDPVDAEWGVLPADTAGHIAAAKRQGGRIVAVGTTSLRLLESAAAETGQVRPFAGETSLFILPGYRFRAVDALMTTPKLQPSCWVM